VHDGARPLVTASTIRRCLALARECGAAAVAAPVTDTLKRADDALMLSGEINREGLWAMQTPQIFRARLLLDVYRPMIERGETATDETSAVARAGHPVRLCPTDSFNLKITYPNDIQLAGQLLAARAREGGAGGSPFA